MSEINSFSDYASKYNTNVDYSYLFGGMQTPSTGSAFNLSDYAAIKNGSYGKLLMAYYAKQDAEKVSSGGDTVQKSTLMKSGADALKKSVLFCKLIYVPFCKLFEGDFLQMTSYTTNYWMTILHFVLHKYTLRQIK